MRFLSQRLRRDPEDFVAQNMLASYFLKRMRETNNVDYLQLATHAADASLASVPRERNPGAFSALRHAEFAGYEFLKARDHAIALTKLEPGQGSGYALLATRCWNWGITAEPPAHFKRCSGWASRAPGRKPGSPVWSCYTAIRRRRGDT